jgi:hypothetical protein
MGVMKASLAPALALLLLSTSLGHAALEFSGYTQTGTDVKFVLNDTADTRSSDWLSLGQGFREHRLQAFDPKEEVLTVEKDGTLLKLPLKKPRFTAAPSGASVEPSPEFRAFVAGLKISGIFLGTNARILADSRVYRVGDTLDRERGIRLLSVDGDPRKIVFEDKTGARVSRAP